MHVLPVVVAATLDTYGNTGVATIQSLQTLFTNVLSVVVALAGVALFIMFVVSGFTFLFSGGDPKKLEQARGTLTNAIVGLVVIVAAYLILRLIGVFTGYTNITKFSVSPIPTSASGCSYHGGCVPNSWVCERSYGQLDCAEHFKCGGHCSAP